MRNNFIKIMGLFFAFSVTLYSKNLPVDTLFAIQQTELGERAFQNSKFDSAVYYHQQAAAVWKEVHQWNKLVTSLRSVAKNLARKADHHGTLKILFEAKIISNTYCFTNYFEISKIYNLIAYTYMQLENYSFAKVYVDSGLAICKEHFGEFHEGTAAGYYTLGTIWRTIGDYVKAKEAFEKSIFIYTSVYGNEHYLLGNVFVPLGAVYDEMNEFDKAIYYYTMANNIFSKGKGKFSLESANCYLNLQSTYNNMGLYDSAIVNGQACIDIFTKLSMPEHTGVAAAYSKFGEIYTALGDYERAKEYYFRSLQIFVNRYPEKLSAIGTLYNRLGDVHRAAGDYDKALKYSLKGIPLLEQSYGALHPQSGFMYELLANIYAERKEFANALLYYRKALLARNQVTSQQSRSDIALLYVELGTVYINQNKYDSAQYYLQQALTLQTEISGRNLHLYSLTLRRIGDLFAQQQLYSKALEQYHRSALVFGDSIEALNYFNVPKLKNSIYAKAFLELIAVKAQTLLLAGKNQKKLVYDLSALSHFQSAMELIDGLRRTYTSEGSKLFLSQLSSVVYSSACSIALTLFEKTHDTQFKEKAFLIADRSKAGILLDRLFDGQAKKYAGVPDSLLQKEKLLTSKIASIEIQMQKVDNSKDSLQPEILDTKEKVLFDLRVDLEKLTKLFEHHYPKYFSLKYSRTIMSVAAIQQSLKKDNMVIEYMLGPEKVWAFILSKNSLEVRTLTHRSQIRTLVAHYTNSLKTFDSEKFYSSSSLLYGALIQPFEKMLLNTTAVTIIPDGELLTIPFESLIQSKNSSGGSIDFSKLQYFISSHEISYSYSADFYITLHTLPHGLTQQFSFVGFAPVFRDSTNNGNFFANREVLTEAGISDLRSITLDGKKFNELKYSEQEIDGISSTFAQHNLSEKIFLHTSASESNFKEFCRSANIVHIATHGYFNEKNSKLSAILFSQPSDKESAEDGILHTDETFSLDLNADLVVLSSCESGAGKLVHGEGLITLTRGFFYSGARNLLYSLWKISDRHTATMMKEFYNNVLNGRSYAASLREAKLKMIALEQTAFPSKWSGFVLVGK